MLRLKQILQERGIKQAALAREIGYSPAVVAELCNKGVRPRSVDRQAFEDKVDAALRKLAGVQFAFAWEVEVAEAGGNPPRPNEAIETIEENMILKKQRLTQKARQHFKLARDPFGDLQSSEDVFVTPDYRYVREAMYQTARHGGFLAVIGESGAGKTTLLRDLQYRLAEESRPTILIRPYVLAMEDSDQKGKTLKSTHIAEAIMAEVAPLEKTKSSPEARFAQLHKALRESAAAGHSHCLVIDEAHALPKPTLAHLKRFLELEVGFRKLLSVILIAQPELKAKLTERDYSVREVVQRCEVVELAPLNDALPAYLKHQFARAGAEVESILDASAVDALRERLTLTQPAAKGRQAQQLSLLHFLAVNNFISAAINLAAEIGAPRVTADVVRGV
jgi:type II secretory pathway predicted ATPase ExeA